MSGMVHIEKASVICLDIQKIYEVLMWIFASMTNETAMQKLQQMGTIYFRKSLSYMNTNYGIQCLPCFAFVKQSSII